jgi:hypothetical protein
MFVWPAKTFYMEILSIMKYFGLDTRKQTSSISKNACEKCFCRTQKKKNKVEILDN